MTMMHGLLCGREFAVCVLNSSGVVVPVVVGKIGTSDVQTDAVAR